MKVVRFAEVTKKLFVSAFSLYIDFATEYPYGGFRRESFDANVHFRKQSVLN